MVKTDKFFVPLHTKIRKSDMEQRFKTSGQDIDLLPLREFIEREGEAVAYRRGDQMELRALIGEHLLSQYEFLKASIRSVVSGYARFSHI